MQKNDARQERSRLLGTMPMGKLVLKISLPIMCSMLIQALYNVVDSIFVSRYCSRHFDWFPSRIVIVFFAEVWIISDVIFPFCI